MSDRLTKQVKGGFATIAGDGEHRGSSDSLQEARVNDIFSHIGEVPDDAEERARFNAELRAGKRSHRD